MPQPFKFAAKVAFTFGVLLGQCGPLAQKPAHFVIAVHTFHDYGPPNNFYDFYVVTPASAGSTIERINVVPAPYQCAQSALLKCAKASMRQSVADLLKNIDPCSLPENSQEDVVDILMQASCNGRQRLIRINSPAATQLLHQLNQAAGEPTLEIGAYANIHATPQLAQSPTIAQMIHRDFDSFFRAAPDKISHIAQDALTAPPSPTVTLLSSSPVRPVSFTLPELPAALREIGWFYQLNFTATVTPDGRVHRVEFNQHPIAFSDVVQRSTEQRMLLWTFPSSPSGQSVTGVIGFGVTCFIPDWP